MPSRFLDHRLIHSLPKHIYIYDGKKICLIIFLLTFPSIIALSLFPSSCSFIFLIFVFCPSSPSFLSYPLHFSLFSTHFFIFLLFLLNFLSYFHHLTHYYSFSPAFRSCFLSSLFSSPVLHHSIKISLLLFVQLLTFFFLFLIFHFMLLLFLSLPLYYSSFSYFPFPFFHIPYLYFVCPFSAFKMKNTTRRKIESQTLSFLSLTYRPQ